MRIERLEYQAQLAQRRYEEVDPSHRLVAATLEQRWNQALRKNFNGSRTTTRSIGSNRESNWALNREPSCSL